MTDGSEGLRPPAPQPNQVAEDYVLKCLVLESEIMIMPHLSVPQISKFSKRIQPDMDTGFTVEIWVVSV